MAKHGKDKSIPNMKALKKFSSGSFL